MFDVIIIGGGPAAAGAGVYVARKQLKSLLITESFSGQSLVSDDIQNWIGEPHISGFDLAKKLETHLRAYPEVLQIHDGVRATVVRKKEKNVGGFFVFEVVTEKETYETLSVIVATGGRRRTLGIPGEKELAGHGVAYCSTCDAPLFKGKTVAVVGGGNAGLEAVQDLLPYASKIYLLNYESEIRGDQATYQKIKHNLRLTVLNNVSTKEIHGGNFVTGLLYLDQETNKEQEIAVQGVFVEIGSVPNSEIVKDVVTLDDHGQIVTDMKFATTSCPGIFAAGDVTDDPFKQNNISVGDGVRAALSAYDYILQRRKQSPAAETDHHGPTQKVS